MFVDNECHTLLENNPMKKAISEYGTKIFSTNSIDSFIEYLEDLEKEIANDHKRIIDQMYGENGVKPFLTLFQK